MKYSLIVLWMSLFLLQGCGGGSDSDSNDDSSGSATCQNADCLVLSELNNKTLNLTYTFGVTYTDTITLNTAYDDTDGGPITAWIEGTGPFGFPALCFRLNSAGYEYFCGWNFSSGSQNLYMFNVSASGTVTGFYEYISSDDTTTNGIVEIINNPDASLFSSTASRNVAAIAASNSEVVDEQNKSEMDLVFDRHDAGKPAESGMESEFAQYRRYFQQID